VATTFKPQRNLSFLLLTFSSSRISIPSREIASAGLLNDTQKSAKFGSLDGN
jgi:hypothetical protein